MEKIDWCFSQKRLKKLIDKIDKKTYDDIKLILEGIDIKTSSGFRKIETLFNIAIAHPDNIKEMYDLYYTLSRTKDKLRVKYGAEYTEAYSINQSNAVKKTHTYKNRFTSLQIEFWLNRGFSKKEAIYKIKSIQSNNGKLAHHDKRNYREDNPLCEEYWMKYGYTLNESQKLKSQFFDEHCNRSLSSYVKKYGLEEGYKKSVKQQLKRKQTMIERYGAHIASGCASKESLLFFQPLYDKLILENIKKDDICWGVEGSREYVINVDKKNEEIYFYDFTVKSKKIIVEYNNRFWHPREDVVWQGFLNEDKLRLKDKRKNEIAIKSGFKLFIIWDDDNFNEKTKEILDYVKQ